jgi:hypothetical protein
MWSDKCTYRRTPVGRKNNVRMSSENKASVNIIKNQIFHTGLTVNGN